MEEQHGPIIDMTDNNGNQIQAELYEIFEFENQKYALLLPLTQENEEEVQNLAVMRLNQEGEQYFIEEIESDLEYARVVEFLQSQCKCNGGCSCDGDCKCDGDRK